LVEIECHASPKGREVPNLNTAGSPEKASRPPVDAFEELRGARHRQKSPDGNKITGKFTGKLTGKP
jgi:hypothetical protein